MEYFESEASHARVHAVAQFSSLQMCEETLWCTRAPSAHFSLAHLSIWLVLGLQMSAMAASAKLLTAIFFGE